jgi:hypothetical protein
MLDFAQAVSSVVERLPFKQGVVGSIPTRPNDLQAWPLPGKHQGNKNPARFVDIEIFYGKCLDICAVLREMPEGLEMLRGSGLLHERLRQGQYDLLKHPPTLDAETILQRIEEGISQVIARHETTSGEVLVRAAYVYAWALFDDGLLSSCMLSLGQERPWLLALEEAKRFPSMEPAEQFRVFRRLRFEFTRDWLRTFRRIAGMRNRAAHERSFPPISLARAHNEVGDLGTHGMQFAIVFCRRFRLPFRFFVPIDGCESFQVPIAKR